MKTSKQNAKTTTKKTNINNHSEKQFSEVISKALIEGGIHLTASKHHGKTRLLFSMAKHLRSLDNCRVLVFDGSLAWLYGFDKIPVLTVGEHDIKLSEDIKTTEQIERYTLENWELTKLALRKHKDILFRLKTRKPSKRGFFIRQIINYLDQKQRTERENTLTHDPKMHICYFVEESQDCFNSRSTVRLEAEEFLTVFNEARNQKEAFFTASQRLNDFSKTLRTKQLYCIGKINFEDKNAFLRRIEKAHNIDFSAMKPRKWFFEGKLFNSPQWKQEGKPFQVNIKLREQYTQTQKPPKGFWERIFSKDQKEDPEKADFEKIEYPEDETEDPTDADLIEFGL